jgi:hypothetical protein
MAFTKEHTRLLLQVVSNQLLEVSVDPLDPDYLQLGLWVRYGSNKTTTRCWQSLLPELNLFQIAMDLRDIETFVKVCHDASPRLATIPPFPYNEIEPISFECSGAHLNVEPDVRSRRVYLSLVSDQPVSKRVSWQRLLEFFNPQPYESLFLTIAQVVLLLDWMNAFSERVSSDSNSLKPKLICRRAYSE